MMFSKEDFKIESAAEFIEFMPIFIFCALVSPFVIAAYKLGFIMDMCGWLKSKDPNPTGSGHH